MNASNNKQAFAEGDTANARRRTTKFVPDESEKKPAEETDNEGDQAEDAELQYILRESPALHSHDQHRHTEY